MDASVRLSFAVDRTWGWPVGLSLPLVVLHDINILHAAGDVKISFWVSQAPHLVCRRHT